MYPEIDIKMKLILGERNLFKRKILGIQYKLGNNSFTYISHNVRVTNKYQEIVETELKDEQDIILKSISNTQCFNFEKVLADRFKFMLYDAKKEMRIENIKLHREGDFDS